MAQVTELHYMHRNNDIIIDVETFGCFHGEKVELYTKTARISR